MGKQFAENLVASGYYSSEILVIQNTPRLIEDLRSQLQIRGLNRALASLDLLLELNKDRPPYRDDGSTPSLVHEITQAIWAINCIENGLHVDDPDDLIALILLHDLGEDTGLKPKELEEYFLAVGFAPNGKLETLIKDFDLISKHHRDNINKYKSDYEYHLALIASKNASLAKLFDRAHNIMTLIGVRGNKAVADYVGKTMVVLNDYIVDVKNRHPDQQEIYETMKIVIEKLGQICNYHLYGDKAGKNLTTDRQHLRNELPEEGFFSLPDGLHPLIFGAQRVHQPLVTRGISRQNYLLENTREN